MPGTTKQVATTNGTESPSAKMRRIMEMNATGDTATNSDAAEQIQNTILSADSDEGVFAAAEAALLSGKELVGVPMAILDFDLVKSTIADSSMPVYARVKAVRLDTGEPFTFSIGGDSSLAQLHQFDRIEPLRERPNGLSCAIAAKKTNAGYEVLWFRQLTPAENANTAPLTQS